MLWEVMERGHALQVSHLPVLSTSPNHVNSKHYNRVHNLRYKCESCAFARADKKELHRHYWVSHRDWAEANNIPDISGKCKGCGRTFGRKDRIRLHLKRYPSCREKLGLSEQES